ncbi:MAG: DUF2948 family protein [Paracoccaceae bacterium]
MSEPGRETEPAAARFEDAPFADRPLRLRAESADDLAVLSARCQDAVGRVADVKWLPTKRRLVILVNRFRWEDAEAARAAGRSFERVRAALSVETARRVRARGVDRGDTEAVLSILALAYAPDAADPDRGGTLTLACAGGVEFEAAVECLDVSLADLTRPWSAQAGAPRHED